MFPPSCPCHLPHLGQEKSLNLLVYFFVSTRTQTQLSACIYGGARSCSLSLSLCARSCLSACLPASLIFSLILLPLVPMHFDNVSGLGCVPLARSCSRSLTCLSTRFRSRTLNRTRKCFSCVCECVRACVCVVPKLKLLLGGAA